MQTYLVGGGVRDKLLGLPVKDRDWVVVGADVEQMIKHGFRPVGKDFPVFLHPETQEEYALARTERKTGTGYKGFTVFADPSVTLEQDLLRRDLTINAIAETETGELIDPFDGQADLANKVLRHVSPAFIEDPVRVLRIARFAARFNFIIADETKALIEQMVANGELDHLVPERVWQELSKALMTDHPSRFFTSLRETSALNVIFPEVEALFGVPQPARWHPEIDTGIHVMMVLDKAAELSDDLAVRYAALCHDLGKGTTPTDILPSHYGHELRGVELTKNLSERFRVPNDVNAFAMKMAEYHSHMHKLFDMRPKTILKLLESLDVFRRPERAEQFSTACDADYRGRTGFENKITPAKAKFTDCYQACKNITAKPFVEAGLTGPAIADAIAEARIEAIRHICDKHTQSHLAT
jgi:tRNA nucleotidyltransferase (CCA-adding enzyme)